MITNNDMKKPKKQTTRQYFIAVLELDDAVPRLKPKQPNLLVTKTLRDLDEFSQAVQLGRTQKHGWAHGRVVRPRHDLSDYTGYTQAEAAKLESRMITALLRKGFTVNSHNEVRRLYVINLNNPKKTDVGAGYVYVGETSHPREKRLQQHLTGESEKGKDLSSNVVKDHGVDLNLDLTPTSTYLTKKQAQKAERRLADRLRAKGYCVEGGH